MAKKEAQAKSNATRPTRKTPFVPGNKLWQRCKNPGRPRNFKTPTELWDKACEYFAWCDNNPLESVEYYGKDATMCLVPKMRAYTWDGLEVFLCVESLREYKTNPSYKEFSQVVARIGKIIYTQKFEGASAGLLNANIIARDLGLRDKSDVDVTTDGKPFAPQIIVKAVD